MKISRLLRRKTGHPKESQRLNGAQIGSRTLFSRVDIAKVLIIKEG